MEAIKKRGRHWFFIIWAGTKVSKKLSDIVVPSLKRIEIFSFQIIWEKFVIITNFVIAPLYKILQLMKVN